MREATERQELGIGFSGVIYAHQLRITIGQAIRDLQLIVEVYEPEDIASRVEFLPL